MSVSPVIPYTQILRRKIIDEFAFRQATPDVLSMIKCMCTEELSRFREPLEAAVEIDDFGSVNIVLWPTDKNAIG
jgi:hypothetical protein